MIDRMYGPLTGAIGEGMSDVLAILINENDVVAEYSSSEPGGIRRKPYTNYPRKYGSVTGAAGVHATARYTPRSGGGYRRSSRHKVSRKSCCSIT
jgi:hypothetical protein